MNPSTKNQICARKSDIVNAEDSHSAYFWKDTNLTLSFIKDHKRELGEELERLATDSLGGDHSQDSLNKVCYDLDKKYNTYYCVGPDNNNTKNKTGCCFAVVDKLC
tara:strand:- start:178 stop:495 length:318 start_codon:yes stop_codon:yes gene_type:complete